MPHHLHLVLDRVAAVLRQAVNHFQSGSLCNSLLAGKKGFAKLCWDHVLAANHEQKSLAGFWQA